LFLGVSIDDPRVAKCNKLAELQEYAKILSTLDMMNAAMYPEEFMLPPKKDEVKEESKRKGR
jgi:hypothetical protein